MVCPRCITAVESILHRFNLSVVSVSLGEATVAEDIDGNIRTALGAELEAIGFELLDSPRSIIVENIKTAVIEWVRITDS
ncbi:MAG: AraC family transcriptional regulator, partial [Muribaculaceae bacterium]